jgi:alkyl sulfatase BDS1-like metallo-beta-lactamase superfamily hydrolase
MKLKRRDFIKGCAAATGALAASGATTLPAVAADAASAQASEFAAALLTPINGNTKPATNVIAALNQGVLDQLPVNDTTDFADAAQYQVTPLTFGAKIDPLAPGYPPVWDLSQYDFLKTEDGGWSQAVPEANPSLWRLAQVNLINGLFYVASAEHNPNQRIYQVRGQDMTNLTIVETDSGILLIDPCQCNQTAAAALKLYQEQRGERLVKAVIYTHSHADHYGGVRGVITDADVQNGVRVIAPENFLKKVISENVLAGTAMSRRSQYSFAFFLARGPRGQIDAGLGKAVSMGIDSLIAPTEIIDKNGPIDDPIDGVTLEFLLTPDAEAPAEMMFYFPQFRVLDAAEVACSLIHNVYTLRGAELRDARMWSYYLNQARDMWGDQSDVVITSHNWPTWGSGNVIKYLETQRDLYKYLHDQTLNLANKGFTMLEIAEELSRKRKLPAGLDQAWFCRSYYGSVSVNLKAMYNKYIGYFDCNPAHIEPLPPEAAAKRYVDMLGGPEAVTARAKTIFDKATSLDDYRWVAELMSHVVFADPTNKKARYLAADALEQLGYQAESAIWRNQYLTGAYELRNGNQSMGKSSVSRDMFKAMEIQSYFDYLGVRLNGAKAEGLTIVLNWVIDGAKYSTNLSNSALTYRLEAFSPTPIDATLTMSRTMLDAINMAPNAQFPNMTSEQAFDAAIDHGLVQVDGNRQKVHQLLGAELNADGKWGGVLLDTFTTTFNIIEP